MAYEKQTWTSGDTVTSAKLNHIEDGIENAGGSGSSLVEITASELKTLKDNSRLVPGTWYRITDYAPTWTGVNFHMAGHAVDILVLATGINELNNNCRFAHHEGDTYFADSDVDAWEGILKFQNIMSSLAFTGSLLQYGSTWSITGSTYDFVQDKDISGDHYYAITSISNVGPSYSGSYPIYIKQNDDKAYTFVDGEMIVNTAFSNINITTVPELLSSFYIDRLIDEFRNDLPYDFKNVIYDSVTINYQTYTNMYTFSSSKASDTTDYSILKDNNIYNNKMIWKKSITELPQNIFVGRSCYGNIFSDSCYSNAFDHDCYSNIFGSDCYSNIFGNNCHNNTFDSLCYSNKFDSLCYSNNFNSRCFQNIFGSSCINNTFGDNCSMNTFGNNYYSNILGSSCQCLVFKSSSQQTLSDLYDLKLASYIWGQSVSNPLNLGFDNMPQIQDVVDRTIPLTYQKDVNKNLIVTWQEGLTIKGKKYNESTKKWEDLTE